MAKFLLVENVKISGFTQNVAVNVDEIERINEEQVTVDGKVLTRCIIVLPASKVTVHTDLNTLLDEIDEIDQLKG